MRRFPLAVLALALACGSDDPEGKGGTDTSPDQVGAACEVAEDCYPEIDHADLQGDALCLDRVPDGYCTHTCGDDADCCAVEGECTSEFPQVCSPFESTGMMMCFLSCESEDVDAAGAPDEQAYCQEHMSPYFICRSSGGGNQNRKVCVPGDCGVGASCAENADCDPDLECLGEFDGGYCGRRDCTADADCPADTVCATLGDANYCLATCDVASDCGLCRDPDHAATCTADVTLVQPASVQVCAPP